MNAEVFKIMILAAIPLLIVEIFMLRSAFCCLASLWRHVGIFEGSAHDYNCVGRAAPGYSGCDP